MGNKPDKNFIDLGERGRYHSRNKLNNLTNKEWIKFTKSWFVHRPNHRKENVMLHPAKYPESLAQEFIEFFTKEGQVVLDPFLGTGSTLIACHDSNRKGYGVELMKKYADIAKERLKNIGGKEQIVIEGTSEEIDKIWKKKSLPKVDFVITSPPYGQMLNKKVGEIYKKRVEEGLDTKYSENDADLGNIKDYNIFIQKLVDIFVKIKPILKDKGYLVVILQNYGNYGRWVPLAWDVGLALDEHFVMKGEKIWCQDHKQLLPYGYRWGWVTNMHHHYCLIFRKE